jgi:DsbE subfamily thiol:disulfide oxidoreductase
MARHRGRARPGSGRTMLVLGFATVLVTGLVITTVGLTGLGATSVAHPGSKAEFTLNDLSGNPIRVSDYLGHPILVNLWASWCPPCRAEMPDLIRFYNAHRTDGLVLLAVNSADNRDSAQQFVRDQQMPFPVLYDPNGSVERLFGVDGLPSTFLLDREGIVRFAWTGQLTTAVLDQRVLPLLAQ